MSGNRVLVGQTMLDLAAVMSSHWEDDRLFVYLDGGRFLQFKGDEAKLLHAALTRDVPQVDEISGVVQ